MSNVVPLSHGLIADKAFYVIEPAPVGHLGAQREFRHKVPCAPMAQVDVTLSAGRDQVGEPWIWKLSRDFNVQVNIKKANVDADFGVFLLELNGPVEEIQRATSWLMTTGLRVEALTRALGA